MKHLFKIIILVLLFVVFYGCFSTVIAEEQSHPFKPGEKMHYVLSWGAISAGEATLEVRAMKEIQGKNAYHFVMTARSNSFIDVFFKVRDRIDAYADAQMNHSLYYKKEQHEGKTRRSIRVDFDWEKSESTYVNFNTKPIIINQVPGSFDPLSVFYFSRMLDLQVGKEFEQPVTDGTKNMMGILRVTGREKVKVKAGTFDTLILEPDMKNVEGVFSKKQRAKTKLWVTDDERRMLVKMKSKAMVGSFVAELDFFRTEAPLKVSRLNKSQ